MGKKKAGRTYLDETLDFAFEVGDLDVLGLDGRLLLVENCPKLLLLRLQVFDLVVEVAELLLHGLAFEPLRGVLWNERRTPTSRDVNLLRLLGLNRIQAN